MKFPPLPGARVLPSRAGRQLLVVLIAISVTTSHAATSLYWDANQGGGGTGGSGTWDTTATLWRNGGTGGTLQAWPVTNPSTSIAYFQGTAGTVTLLANTTLYANGLNFGTVDYQLASGNSSSKLILNGIAPSVTIAANQNHAFNTRIELGDGTTFTRTDNTGTAGVLAIGTTGSGTLTVASGAQVTLFSSTSTTGLGVARVISSSGALTATSTADFSGGRVTGYLEVLRVGQRSLTGNGSGNLAGSIDFGTDSGTSIQITANEPVVLGVLGLGSSTYTGSVSGTMDTRAGTHTYVKNSNASTNGIKIGEISATAANGTNVASASGTWNISGGTTTLGISGTATRADVLLGNRSAILGTNSTSSGTLNLTGGTLELAAGDVVDGGGSSTFVLNGGTLNLNGGLLGRAGALIDQLTLQSGTLQNVGGINNGAGLTKSLTGTLTLSGTSSYAGDTTVTAGTLVINGAKTGTGTVAIGSAATLGGSGTIAGATTIAGTHRPGNSPGLQTFSTSLDYMDGSNVVWELTSNTESGRGTNFDGINVGTDLTITGTSVINLSFNVGSSVVWADSFWNANHLWQFYAVAGTTSGDFAIGSISTDSLGNALGGRGSFSIETLDDDVWIRFTAIPEPSAAWLLIPGGLLAWFRRRSLAA